MGVGLQDNAQRDSDQFRALLRCLLWEMASAMMRSAGCDKCIMAEAISCEERIAAPVLMARVSALLFTDFISEWKPSENKWEILRVRLHFHTGRAGPVCLNSKCVPISGRSAVS